MKNYLSLASIQARVHKKQNRMTLFCIAIAVILITGVFTMADMEVRHETERMMREHGNWHISIVNTTKDEAESVLNDTSVKYYSWYDALNYDLQLGYTVCGKNVVVCGADKDWDEIMYCMVNGRFPSKENEVALSENVAKENNKTLGDTLTVKTSTGEFTYVISGICKTEKLKEYDAAGIFLTMDDFNKFAKDNNEELHPQFFVQFRNTLTIRSTINQLKEKHNWGKENIAENTAVLGILGMSSGSYVVGLYGVAIVLGLLVVAAGILMIAGSMNSNIAQRTQYFGMLRCIGTSKRQIRRLVQIEALNWCKRAIPIGVIIATLASWGICLVLRYVIGGEWADMPIFKISIPGILSGSVIGIITVLLAAHAPAKRAAKVTPVSAISGNANSENVRYNAKTDIFKIDSALGIYHAISKKKSMIMMTGSFALSIIIFLCFSVMIDWIGNALNTNKVYTKDMAVYYDNYESNISKELVKKIEGVDGIKRVYGRMHANVDITSTKDVSKMDLISYESQQFEWAKKDFLKGDISKVIEGNGNVMTVFDKKNPLELGDKIWYNGNELTVAALLSDSPFSATDVPTILCSEDTFTSLTGITKYAVIDMQVNKDARESIDIDVRNLLDENMRLSDVRTSNKESNSTYNAFIILVYGFLIMLALITIFNIMNSISMSVSARNKQYGIMRAIGMDNRQIRQMILAEAGTYAVIGCVVGALIGLYLHFIVYNRMITHYFGTPWSFPTLNLIIIILVVVASAVLAVRRPAKRVLEKTITETISEL